MPHLAAISSLAMELAATSREVDLAPLLADRLRLLTGAEVVAFSDYDEACGQLRLSHLASNNALLSRIHQIIGRSLIGLRMRLSPELQAQLLSTPVVHVPDLATLTLGAVPEAVSGVLQRLAPVGGLRVLGYQVDGRLIGTSSVICRVGVPPVPDEVLIVFSNLASAALARQRDERALSLSEARFHAIVDAVNEGILACDLESGAIVTANRTALEMLGCTLDHLREHGIAAFCPASGEWSRARLAAALRAGAQGEPQSCEWRCQRKDGAGFWAELDIRRATLGDQDRLLVLMRDISRRKEAEAARAKLEEQFRHSQKMESIGRLAGGVAHDFNNLLTAIMGNVELARDAVAAPVARERLDEALRASESAAALTRQLLAFSRKQMIAPRVLQLGEVLANVQRLLGRLIGEHIEVRRAGTEDLWPVCVDAGQFEQVVVNLAVNARDAMPDGGVLTIITDNLVVDARSSALLPGLRPGPYVQLAIRDTGRGMTDEVKAHLFEPFFTTKERGRGTGLGLAMVYGAVQQMGGTVDVQSALGAGTTVRLLLPGLPDEDAGSAATPPADADAARGGHETILLAEDDAAVRGLATRLLERLGYRVVACVDGAQALEVAGQLGASLDLLLTDIVMPGMNGRALAEHLRALRPTLRVVLTSGYSEDLLGDAAPGEDVHFIAKPYTSESLARKVREALDEAQG